MTIPHLFNVSEQTPYGPRQMDLYSHLLNQQIIFLNGDINVNMAESIIAQLLYLEDKEFEGDIRIYINSPGGVISAGLAIYDTMQCMKCDAATICVGEAASMAAILLAAGTKGRRMAYPNARVMIHQPLGSVRGQSVEINIQARELDRVKKLLDDILVYHTGQPIEVIENDTNRDFFLTAEKALEYGLVDRIIRTGEGVL